MAADMGLLKPITFRPETGGNSASKAIFRFNQAPKKPAYARSVPRMSATAIPTTGKGTSKKGKTQIKETLLTPRFYTTDFEEMEALFNTEINKNLDMTEFAALLQEFKTDYNQTHFVRNKEFKEAADKMQGPLREIFVEFLERSCTAEFSGFLLYKELGRRLKKTNPVIAEIFALMSRDEARHAGFLNKGLADFNLALDLGFLTKARKYTFFKPKFIFYATYLSEEIGYWRYITIYRHLKANPDFQVHPIFKFLNKGLADFNLALDLGFLTKARKYTFFKPKFIFYATYLSEKIGYWRYITIYRHLKANPDFQVHPIFKYLENWCQDENRHGDFFSALLKAQPQFLNDWQSKRWSRFFCLSVYVTMYFNDCQRTSFYEGIGLSTKEFDMHVIIETNRTTARIFPAVLDVENPEFKRKLDRMVEINSEITAVSNSNDPDFPKNLKKIPLVAALASEILAAYLMPPVESGSVNFAEFEPRLVY